MGQGFSEPADLCVARDSKCGHPQARIWPGGSQRSGASQLAGVGVLLQVDLPGSAVITGLIANGWVLGPPAARRAARDGAQTGACGGPRLSARRPADSR